MTFRIDKGSRPATSAKKPRLNKANLISSSPLSDITNGMILQSFV